MGIVQRISSYISFSVFGLSVRLPSALIWKRIPLLNVLIFQTCFILLFNHSSLDSDVSAFCLHTKKPMHYPSAFFGGANPSILFNSYYFFLYLSVFSEWATFFALFFLFFTASGRYLLGGRSAGCLHFFFPLSAATMSMGG